MAYSRAASFEATASKCDTIVADARSGKFAPVYILMGAEPYFTDIACQAIIDSALVDFERDFNQTIFYGADTTANDVATEARMYPMMAERRLVVVKDAQNLPQRSWENLSEYCEEPMESTVLVLLFRGEKGPDKRKALYKSVSKIGVILDSPLVKDYEMPRWVEWYFRRRGLSIEPDAAALFAEFVGTNMANVDTETEKMLRNLGDGVKNITVGDVEKNVGMSRDVSVFELTKALGSRDRGKCMRLAARIGRAHGFAMPMATALLFTHFYRLLKYNAFLVGSPRASQGERAQVLGVPPYLVRDYDSAIGYYTIPRCQRIISLIEEFDFKAKGGDGLQVPDGELLEELVVKILMI